MFILFTVGLTMLAVGSFALGVTVGRVAERRAAYAHWLKEDLNGNP